MGKQSTSIEAIYGGDDIYSPRAIQEYLNRLRRADRAACTEIADTAEALQQVIANSPGIGVLLGYDSKRKARMICEPLQEAANAHSAAANLAVLSWQRFYKHFGGVIEQTRQAKRGAGRKTMDWTDA
jgi:hypothetical protein